MIRLFSFTTALLFLFGGVALAETHEVEMLNEGSNGKVMVFEPSFVQAAPGDTIKFIPTDKGHNAIATEKMIPQGAESFQGVINEELAVTLSTEGIYGVLCLPHYGLGMVMTIAVGEVEASDDHIQGQIPPKARARFEEQLTNL